MLAALAALLVAVPGLHDGETRWFAPGVLRAGATVRCTVDAVTIRAKVPRPPSSGSLGGFDWVRGGAKVSIEVRPDGAAQVICGTSGLAVPHRPRLPYVIGPNGLALVRGPDRLPALERRFGKTVVLHVSGGRCHAAWVSRGLRAIFTGASCTTPGALSDATVTGPQWMSLRGVQIGDTLDRLRWEAPDAKSMGKGVWQLAAASASQSVLVAAVGPSGRVVSLTCRVR